MSARAAAKAPGAGARGLTRTLLGHTGPVLVAQLASISTTVVDSMVAGHSSTLDLAAVGIGSGLYLSVLLACAGILQALAPIAGRHHGAGRDDLLPGVLQQGLWLALALGLAGFVLLRHPDLLLGLSDMSAEVRERARAYLATLAWALPAALTYRCCGAFFNALGQPRSLMHIGLVYAGAHVLLAPSLATLAPDGVRLGAVGCALSVVLLNYLAAGAALSLLALRPVNRRLHLCAAWQAPRPAAIAGLLRLGLPIGLSAFVEMTAYGLIALLLAPLGPSAVASHRVVASLAGVCYMTPLALSIATLTHVARAAGGQRHGDLRALVRIALVLAAGLALVLGAGLWLGGETLIAAYSADPAVRSGALAVIGIVALYQLSDALQTVAAQSLRGLHVTFVPMLIHIGCFWGLGLGGGYWLCYRHGLGVAGFWWAALAATLVAGIAFGSLLRLRLQRLV